MTDAGAEPTRRSRPPPSCWSATGTTGVEVLMLHRVSKVAFGACGCSPAARSTTTTASRATTRPTRPGARPPGRRWRSAAWPSTRTTSCRSPTGCRRPITPRRFSTHFFLARASDGRGGRGRRRDPRARVAGGAGGARPPRPRRGRPGAAHVGHAARPRRARHRRGGARGGRRAATRSPTTRPAGSPSTAGPSRCGPATAATRPTTRDQPGGRHRLWMLEDGWRLERIVIEAQAPAASHRSISVRAMLIPGGIIGRSSARNHWASTISFSSMTMSPLGPCGLEPDHQRVRERPRLAGDVAHVGDRHADLLAHLAVDGLLHRLAGLHEAGDAAVHRHRERAAASQQRLAVALDERDHRRRQAWEREQPARRAPPRPLPGHGFGWRCRTGRRTASCDPSRRAAPRDRRASSARRRRARTGP